MLCRPLPVRAAARTRMGRMRTTVMTTAVTRTAATGTTTAPWSAASAPSPARACAPRWTAACTSSGGPQLLGAHADDPALLETVAGLERQGKTAVVVGDEDGALGVIAVSDPLRPDARRAVAMLRDLGVERGRHAHRRQSRDGRGRGRAGRRRRRPRRPAAGREGRRRHRAARPLRRGRDGRRRRQRRSGAGRRRLSASPWARPAPTPPSRPPTSP